MREKKKKKGLEDVRSGMTSLFQLVSSISHCRNVSTVAFPFTLNYFLFPPHKQYNNRKDDRVFFFFFCTRDIFLQVARRISFGEAIIQRRI